MQFLNPQLVYCISMVQTSKIVILCFKHTHSYLEDLPRETNIHFREETSLMSHYCYCHTFQSKSITKNFKERKFYNSNSNTHKQLPLISFNLIPFCL